MSNISQKRSIYPFIFISLFSIYYVSPFEVNGEFSFIAAILKILPILYLIFYMKSYLKTIRFKSLTTKESESDSHLQKQRHLAIGVTWGFVFSLFGDLALLIFFSFVAKTVHSAIQPTNIQLHLLINEKEEVYLIAGVVAFSIAQLCYIYAFGFQVTRAKLGLSLYALVAIISVFVLWQVPLKLKLIIYGYGALLVTSLWRALDRTQYEDGRPTYKKLLLPIGLASFLLSDVWIGVSTFVLTDHSNSSMHFILFTYYAAQGLLAVAST